MGEGVLIFDCLVSVSVGRFLKQMWPFMRKTDALNSQEAIEALSPVLFVEEDGIITAYRNLAAFQFRLMTETLPTGHFACYDKDGYEIPLAWVKESGPSVRGTARAEKAGKRPPGHHHTLRIQAMRRRYMAKELKQAIIVYLREQYGIEMDRVTPLAVCIERLISVAGLH